MKIWTFITLFLFVVNLLFAQTNQESTKPLELPTFIIEGVEMINLQSGIKQFPTKPDILTSKELDSLNTYEKQLPTLLPPTDLPSHYVTKEYNSGYLQANYGLFNSMEIVGAYKFLWDRFNIFANAGWMQSDGDAEYSNNNKLFANIRSNYIAEDKWFIFGGSHTATNLFINSQSYNMYGIWDKNLTASDKKKLGIKIDEYDRNMTQLKFDILSNGAYESVLFSVGATANYIEINNNDKASRYLFKDNISDYYAKGFLTIKNYWNNFLVGANININIENAFGSQLNYYQFDASASYFENKFSLLLKAGFQICNNSSDISRGGLLLSANLEYRLNKLWTVDADFYSGISKTDFEEIVFLNPYISTRLTIDHRYDIANVRGRVWYHPNDKLSLNAGIKWRYSERNLNFVYDSLGEFKLDYVNGIIFDVFGEGIWQINDNNRLVGKLNLNMSDLENKEHLTYTPLFIFSTTYHKMFWDKLGTFVSLELTGSRNISTKVDGTLNPYFILNVGADYTLGQFNIFLKINNLTNSTYYIWDKYREREFFGKIGVMWIIK